MRVSQRGATGSVFTVTVMIAALLGACAASRRRAEWAYERGNYRLAAEMYDEMLREKPNDGELQARRADAVSKLHRVELTAVLRARRSSDVEGTIRALGVLLTSRAHWTPNGSTLGDPQLDTSLATTVRWVREVLTAELRAELRARRLLGVAPLLERRSSQLPFAELEALWPALREELRVATQQHCREAMPEEPSSSPFLTDLLISYCRALSAPVPAAPALGLAGGVGVAVAIEGVSTGQAQAVQEAVAATFVESAWHEAGSARRLRGSVGGTNDYRFTARPEVINASWTEMVSYQATETYQQSYTDYEHYTAQVPYTAYRSESYSCGSYKEHRTCTRSVPSTQYRTESRTRPVTRYRPATRTVTKYRPEGRVHTYEAVRRDGAYVARWQVLLGLEGAADPYLLAFTENVSLSQHGYDHDESFAPAGISPGRANLMSPEQWFEYVRASLRARLGEELQQRWHASFCRPSDFTPETAARCARGAAAPTAARAALARVFGADTDEVLVRFTHRGVRSGRK